jgi:hypothetical protein
MNNVEIILALMILPFKTTIEEGDKGQEAPPQEKEAQVYKQAFLSFQSFSCLGA